MIDTLSKEIRDFEERAKYYDEVPAKTNFIELMARFRDEVENLEQEIDTLADEIERMKK